jgi:hypothetical protein
MAAKKAPGRVVREPLRLLTFLKKTALAEYKVIAVELAEDDGGMFYVFINTVDYLRGTYNKRLVISLDAEYAAERIYRTEIDAAYTVGYKDVGDGENLNGFSPLLEFTHKHINNHTQPETIEEEGFRKMII